jgi:hypothetical protein
MLAHLGQRELVDGCERAEVSSKLFGHVSLLLVGLKIIHHHSEHGLLVKDFLKLALEGLRVKLQLLVARLVDFELVRLSRRNAVRLDCEYVDLLDDVLVALVGPLRQLIEYTLGLQSSEELGLLLLFFGLVHHIVYPLQEANCHGGVVEVKAVDHLLVHLLIEVAGVVAGGLVNLVEAVGHIVGDVDKNPNRLFLHILVERREFEEILKVFARVFRDRIDADLVEEGDVQDLADSLDQLVVLQVLAILDDEHELLDAALLNELFDKLVQLGPEVVGNLFEFSDNLVVPNVLLLFLLD